MFDCGGRDGHSDDRSRSAGTARGHLPRCRRQGSRRPDHPRIRPDRSRRQQSAGHHGSSLSASRRSARSEGRVERSDRQARLVRKQGRRSPIRNNVTIGDYATDTHNWVAAIRQQTGQRMRLGAWSQRRRARRARGGSAADGICGVIVVSGAGRKLGDVIREQLRANPANAPVLDSAMAALDQLERGQHVDVSKHAPGASAAVRAAGAGLPHRHVPAGSGEACGVAEGAAADRSGRARPAGVDRRCARRLPRRSPRRSWC